MSLYRQYKNGIFGHRYRGYYITRNNNNQYKRGKLYTVIDKERNVIFADNPDFFDCEWEIDKMVASDDEMTLYIKLYKMEINTLHQLAAKYSQKTEEETITKDEKKLYRTVEKIMRRKIAEKPF